MESGWMMSDACHVYRACHEELWGGRMFDRRPWGIPSAVDGRASSLIEWGRVVVLGEHLVSYEIAQEADVWAWLSWW